MLNKKAKQKHQYHEKFTKQGANHYELFHYPSKQEWTGANSTPA